MSNRVGARPGDGRQAPAANRRVLWTLLGLALLVRLLVFPFADNKQADAPMRVLLAEYRNGVPGAASDPRTFFQFGPLPIELVRPFLALGGDARVLSRVPFLLAGLAVFVPFLALARRMTGRPRAVVVAGLALALSPLHVQLSTTAASEAVYLLFWIAALERLHVAVSSWQTLTARRRLDFALAGTFASLAAVSRYDAWLALPAALAAAWVLGPRDRRAAADLAVFAAAAASLPVAYLVWLWAATGDPWFFARTIAHEHATAATAMAQRLGNWGARLHQVAIWAVALVAAMTPLPFVGLAAAWRCRRRVGTGTTVVVLATLAPFGVYLVKGLLAGAFVPLPRFALVPGVVLLPLGAAALAVRMRQVAGVVAAGAVAWAAGASLAAFGGRGRIWGEAEAVAPLTRLDREDRVVAEYLAGQRKPGEVVFVDTFEFVDIMIAHAARVPLSEVATLWRTRVLRDSVADERAQTDAKLFAAYDGSWGSRPLLDWPADGVRLGSWRVARMP